MVSDIDFLGNYDFAILEKFKIGNDLKLVM